VNISSWHCGWIFQEKYRLFSLLDEASQDEIIPTEGGEYTGDVHPVLFTECYALLRKFNPRRWAANIEKVVSTKLHYFRPQNMIWAQIMLLDIAIHVLVRGGFYHGHKEGYDIWTKEVVAVIQAVVDSWDGCAVNVDTSKSCLVTPDDLRDRQASNSSNQQSSRPGQGLTPPSREEVVWDLAGSLRKQPDLFKNLSADERLKKVDKLAALLQLRALFVMALFMVMPDSSDVWMADRYTVQMPMI
jgi:hypothetical protein